MKNLLTRRKFVAAATAVGVASGFPLYGSKSTGDLESVVRHLPEGSPEEKRKRAMLLWAIEDARAAEAAGLSADRDATLADVEAALSMNLGKAEKPPAGLVPQIATPRDNPWLERTFNDTVGLLGGNMIFPRGSDADKKEMPIKKGYPYIHITQEGLLLAHALANPQTNLCGDARLLAPMLRRFQANFEVWGEGSKLLADFGISPWGSEMYAVFKATYPSLILPSKQKAWEQALRNNTEAILKHRADVSGEKRDYSLRELFANPVEGACYPNSHSHYMNAVLFAGIALGDAEYRKLGGSAVQLMAMAFQPDGGTAYIGFQNECLTYHGIMIEDLIRNSQVTGSARALELAKSSRWYYPLAMTPQGVAEYSSAPCWKHYWNSVSGANTAMMVAALNNCGYNMRVAAMNGPSDAGWLAASLYKPVKPAEWWDNQMFHDRNIEGPRGRFGNWSFEATSRNTRTETRGKLTYVGGLITERNPALIQQLKGWQIHAGLDGVWAEARQNTKGETVNRWDTHACLAVNETTACMTGSGAGAVTTLNRLSQYGRAATEWQGAQQWIVTPKRMVGLLRLSAPTDLEAFSAGFAVKTVSGRDTGGIRKEWKQVSATEFHYGDLVVRFWVPDAADKGNLALAGKILTGYTDTFSGNSKKCGLLSLIDADAAALNQAKSVKYAKGTAFHALVEIYPNWSGPSAAVRVEHGDLSMLELEADGGVLRLIHNQTQQEQSYSSKNGKGLLHLPGEAYRGSFLPEVESRAAEKFSGGFEHRIAAGEFVLAEKL